MKYTIGYIPTSPTMTVQAIERRIVIDSVFVANSTNSTIHYTMYHVSADTAVSGDQMMIHDKALTQKVGHLIDQPIVLEPGESIWLESDTSDAAVATFFEKVG